MRLKGISKSPIMSLFQESFNGLPIIRSFERENDFCRRMQDNVNKYSVPLLAITAADRWFAIRLDIIGIYPFYSSLSLFLFCSHIIIPLNSHDMINIELTITGAFVVFFSTFFSLVIFRNSVESGFVGLSITYSLTISGYVYLEEVYHTKHLIAHNYLR